MLDTIASLVEQMGPQAFRTISLVGFAGLLSGVAVLRGRGRPWYAGAMIAVTLGLGGLHYWFSLSKVEAAASMVSGDAVARVREAGASEARVCIYYAGAMAALQGALLGAGVLLRR